MKAIQKGETAPDFNALDQNRERFFLSKAVQKGKVLLAFYPGDDTPVCTAQLNDYSKNIEEFKKRGVQVYGISISSNESQKKFAEKLELKFPLLADYDTRVTTKYGVMSFTGYPKRA
ncbi:MAG: redoxin domain-containing protein, partial [bacterium]|nr:redoxin domain-containing protein [bacterium]